MKTTHLIALTATIVACTAATASARPAVEQAGSQASRPSAVNSGSIAAHREQISNEQWQRSQAQPDAAPPTNTTASDDGFPLVLVLIGLSTALGLVLLMAGKPMLAYSRHRRHPTGVA